MQYPVSLLLLPTRQSLIKQLEHSLSGSTLEPAFLAERSGSRNTKSGVDFPSPDSLPIASVECQTAETEAAKLGCGTKMETQLKSTSTQSKTEACLMKLPLGNRGTILPQALPKNWSILTTQMSDLKLGWIGFPLLRQNLRVDCSKISMSDKGIYRQLPKGSWIDRRTDRMSSRPLNCVPLRRSPALDQAIDDQDLERN